MTIAFQGRDDSILHTDSWPRVTRYIFIVPEDMYIIGFKAAVFRNDGTPLPRQHLHHVYLLNMDQEKASCPGVPALIAGTGMEMVDARFPDGYGVKIKKGSRLLAGVALYHNTPLLDDIIATFAMELTPEGRELKPLESYQVSVTNDCDADQLERPKKGDAEGIELRHGVQVESIPIKFRTSGCVKFVYPHGHDNLLLLALENKTTRKTLLRTVPETNADGSIVGFSHSHVYRNDLGFSVNTDDEYEMTMVYHRPLQDASVRHAMGIYVLYMTRGQCTEAR